MRALSHVIYNLAYTYKFHLRTTLDWCLLGHLHYTQSFACAFLRSGENSQWRLWFPWHMYLRKTYKTMRYKNQICRLWFRRIMVKSKNHYFEFFKKRVFFIFFWCIITPLIIKKLKKNSKFFKTLPITNSKAKTTRAMRPSVLPSSVPVEGSQNLGDPSIF